MEAGGCEYSLIYIFERWLHIIVATFFCFKMGLAFKGIEMETIKYYQLPGPGITAHDPLVGVLIRKPHSELEPLAQSRNIMGIKGS